MLKEILRDGARRFGPTTFLAGMIGFGYWLYTGLDPSSNLSAYSEPTEHHLTTTEAGIVEEVLVLEGQAVATGDVLLRVVDPGIKSEVNVIEREIDRVRAEITWARRETSRTDADRTRAFSADVEDARVALAAESARLSEAKAELAAVEVERDQLKTQSDAGFADLRGARELNVRRARAKEAAESARRTIGVLEKNVRAAKSRADRSDEPRDESADPRREELRVLEAQRTALLDRMEVLTLRAPIDGFVGSVDVRVGEVVKPDAPAVSVVDPMHARLVICAPERAKQALVPGAVVEYVPRYANLASEVSQITAVDPRVKVLPDRCQPGVTRVLGTTGTLTLPPTETYELGATYDVRIIDGPGALPQSRVLRATAPQPAVQASATVSETGGVATLQRSEFSRALTRFELSGAVWTPELNAYLAVVDDTGHKGRGRQPWAFTVDRNDKIADDPVVIRGIETIDDLEAIARADDGTFYLATSHGRTKKGKRRDAREQVLRAELDGRTLRVTGSFSLRSLIDDSPPSARAGLGLDEDGQLEVEGLEARGGTLYFGLKHPVGGEGALIWALADADRAFDEEINLHAFRLHAAVDLRVPDGNGGRSAGGVSALRFGDDGALWIASTPTDPSIEADVGALYRLDVGASEPTLVRELLHGKPEALAWSEDDSLWVGYDADEKAPSRQLVSTKGPR